jgi:hypothetical protein
MKATNKIFVAVPVMQEFENMPGFLECLKQQSFQNFKLLVCINQPDDWWDNPVKREICEDNSKTLAYLRSVKGLDLEFIDRSSPGKGWQGKKSGVGWARKELMDKIISEAEGQDLIVSLDADTRFEPDYFTSLVENFVEHPKAAAISVPYYHPLTNNEEKDRAILRYEIYLRYFAINLHLIESPYNFTAVGSAIVLPVGTYNAIGGITPHKSGEDFYFLQKIRKYGTVLTWNRERVYPEARYSDRVGFGTGPAMIKGAKGDWSSYPIFPFAYFDEIRETYQCFHELYERNVSTPMDQFLEIKFGKNFWQPLRENFKTLEKFVWACHLKIDGFRVIQYLKWRNNDNSQSDEQNLISWFEGIYAEEAELLSFDFRNISFAKNRVDKLDELRNLLVTLEARFQKG